MGRRKRMVLQDQKGKFLELNFDQGGLASYSVESISPLTIRINPLLDLSGTTSQWWAVKSKRWGGKTPVFVFAVSSNWFNLTAGMWVGAWARASDTDTWYGFDNITVGVTDIEISNNAAFPSGTIYVSLIPMYPFSRTQRLVNQWSGNALVGDTTSSTNKILALSTAVTPDANQRAPLGLPYYAFKVANATANTKNKAILTSRLHAAEGIGGWSFEAAIDWLLTTSPEQKFLLDWFEFNCYPCLHPVNVVGGHSRMLWEDYTKDCNTQWDTDGTREYVDVQKAAMIADTGGTIEVGLDYHSYGADVGPIGIVESAADAMVVAFRTQLLTLQADWGLLEQTITGGTTYLWKNTLSARLVAYYEHGLDNAKGISDWKTYGANSMKALAKTLAAGYFTNGPSVGARDFNGTTDRIDWANVYNPKGTPTTISMWLYLDTNKANQYFLNIGEGNTYGMWLATGSAAGVMQLGIMGAGWGARVTNTAFIVAGAWMNIVATYSGTFGPLASTRFYKNGVEATYNDAQGVVGTAPENDHTGSWSIGGRIADDARNMDGIACQVAVWDRVLSAGEIANLAAGYSPDLAAPSNLKFYFKGNTSSLANSVTGGANGTADGTTQLTGAGTGPAIIYP